MKTVTKMEASHTVSLRPTYADTDQMGFVHHSNYVKYLEFARWEAFRQMGITYKEIEEKGILMPVIDMNLQFIKPAYYDDLLKIEIEINLGRPTKLLVDYHIYNQMNELIHRANTTLAFLSKKSRKPHGIPSFIQNKIM